MHGMMIAIAQTPIISQAMIVERVVIMCLCHQRQDYAFGGDGDRNEADGHQALFWIKGMASRLAAATITPKVARAAAPPRCAIQHDMVMLLLNHALSVVVRLGFRSARQTRSRRHDRASARSCNSLPPSSAVCRNPGRGGRSYQLASMARMPR